MEVRVLRVRKLRILFGTPLVCLFLTSCSFRTDNRIAIDSTDVHSETIVVDDKPCLFMQGVRVSVLENDVFDVVSYSDNRIDVSSSLILDGQPVMSVTIVPNEDAYIRAVSDKDTVWSFYETLGLSELYVSADIIQSCIAGHISYSYHTQYTNPEYGYVCQEYITHFVLDNGFAKVVIRSLTDQGVSTVLTDTYANAMLSQVSIERSGDK